MFQQESQLIHMTAQAGIPLPQADVCELWELAAACGVHRIETWAEHDERTLIAGAAEYYEETKEIRAEKMDGYMERRKARERERRQARREKVT